MKVQCFVIWQGKEILWQAITNAFRTLKFSMHRCKTNDQCVRWIRVKAGWHFLAICAGWREKNANSDQLKHFTNVSNFPKLFELEKTRKKSPNPCNVSLWRFQNKTFQCVDLEWLYFKISFFLKKGLKAQKSKDFGFGSN